MGQRLLGSDDVRQLSIPVQSRLHVLPKTLVQTRWSDYNHNVSGLFPVVMALTALVSQVGWTSWARYWPLGFVALSIFILVHSDARSSWPFG